LNLQRKVREGMTRKRLTGSSPGRDESQSARFIEAGGERKVCPECQHTFRGNGWDGIDAHWKSRHGEVMSYEEAWPLIRAGTYVSTSKIVTSNRATRFSEAARRPGASGDEHLFDADLKKTEAPTLAMRPNPRSRHSGA
jgi:hypothetical protein